MQTRRKEDNIGLFLLGFGSSSSKCLRCQIAESAMRPFAITFVAKNDTTAVLSRRVLFVCQTRCATCPFDR